MAENSNPDSSKKIIEIEEQIEGEHVETNDYFFCKVGESISLMSDNSTFDANDPPSNPLVFSRSHGLIFAAHSSGFCVAKIKDVVAAAKDIQDNGSGSSIQELSVVDVQIGRVSILALSMDSSYVAAVVGGEIQCFSVESLLNKDYKPSFNCSVESNHVKDMLWIKETESFFVVLTYDGTLHLGSFNKSLKHVMDGVDAVGRSVDGNQIAVGRKNSLSIFSSNFEELSQVLLPMDIWTGESDTIRVDGIRWVRSDSIVVGFFQQNEDDKEENYFIQVIMNKQGQNINDSAKLISVDFSDLFTGIVDDIVPAGCGPHLFVNYLENCGFAFVSNRKNVDQHIMLFDWAEEGNLVSVVDIERDTFLPRIELQESGDDNLILGLCVDDSSVYENVKVKSGVEEEKELPSHCLLMCLTLEGKLIMFNVARITRTRHSTQDLSSASSNAQSVSVVGHSNIGGTVLRSEEERAKQSASDLKLRELEARKFSSALNEVPSEKDQKQSQQSNYTLGASKFDQNIKPELIAGSNNQQAVADVNKSKPFGRLGQPEGGRMSVAGDVIGTEKSNVEHGLSRTDNFLDKNHTSIGRGVEEKIKSGDSNRISTTTTSGTSLRSSGLSNAQSLFTSPAFAKSTFSGSHLAPTDMASSSGSIFGNLGARPTVSSNSGTGSALDYNKKSSSSGLSGLSLSTPSSKVPLQESGKSLNLTGQSMQPMLGHEKKSSPLNSEQNLSKQFSSVQNMANELDKLLQSIEEAGGFRDVCTAAHKSSLEALEEGMDSLSERNRVWQSCMEARLKEIQLLLDKTVQVLARKTHMEGIVRQTTDGQYWDLWNRQKLNSELDQKRLNVYNRSQDLINRMIELEKHFNTLELNLYGESSGAHFVSGALNSRSAPSRHNQSLHAVHNATISQLAAAKQLSDSLSKQMNLLSIKSPPTKRSTVKKQVFESIGIPYPDDSLSSPNTAKVMESPSNRRPSVSRSGEARTDSKRIHLSGVSSHDLETARRRRDSLDRNWANFEAPKTTVKRILVQNERQNAGSLFSSMDKHFVSPGKLEKPVSNQSKVLLAQDRNGRMDMTQKLNSDTTATSKYKWAGGIPELSQTVTEQPPRWQILQGDSFPVTQNRSSSALSSSSSLSTASVDPIIKKGNILSTAERPGPQAENIDKSNRFGTASTETKPYVLQFTEQKSTIQKIQPQISSFPFGGKESISDNKETDLTKPAAGQLFLEASKSKQSVEASPSLVFPPFGSSSSPNLSCQTLPITSGDSGSITSLQIAKDVNKEVLQVPSSSISVPSSSAEHMNSLISAESKEVLRVPTSAITVSAPQAAPVISPSSKGTESVSTDSTKSSVYTAEEPLKISPEATVNKERSGDELVVTQSVESLASSSSDGNFAQLVSPASSVEVPKAFASNPDINKSATPINGAVLSTPEKQPAPITSSLAFPSDLGGATGGKSIIENSLTQEDEMEEEAPETIQTAQTSLGSFAGFGIGSTPPSTTAPKNNPFGGPIASAPQTMATSISLTVPSGELFRPASFSFQSLQASQPSQPANIGAPNTFGFANSPQMSSGGFGQPSQIGSGQQALGSVLGSFGQSRQLGSGLPGSGFGVAQSPGGGFVNAPPSGGFGGGFATASAGGGFAAAAPSGGGFAAAAQSGGGFAAAAQSGGGFAAAAQSGGGFAAAAQSGGGFAAAPPSVGGFASAGGGAGGFGAFGNTGTSGFTGFGGGSGGRQAPSELFTQMRK